jgi:hypothetical protein
LPKALLRVANTADAADAPPRNVLLEITNPPLPALTIESHTAAAAVE